MRRMKKAIVSLSLIAAMIMGEAGVVLAVGPNQAADGTEISANVTCTESEMEAEEGISDETVTETEENMTDEVVTETEENATDEAVTETSEVIIEDVDLVGHEEAGISRLSVTEHSIQGKIYITVNGTGCKFTVNINDKFFTEIDNSEDVTETNPAPSIYNRQVIFEDVLPGATYKVEVVPYVNTEAGPVAGEAVTKTLSATPLNISGMWTNQQTDYKANGYSKEGGITLGWRCDRDIYGTNYTGMEFELQRKEGNGVWKTVAKTHDRQYTDNNVIFGKTYQYRVRVNDNEDEYAKALQSQWFVLKNISLHVTDVNLIATYESLSGNVNLQVADGAAGICSGYEIYRSTNKTKGYKKIAKIASESYMDKKVKSGTYYYKARAYYYNEATGKTYYGNFTEPKGIKVIVGDLYVSAKQTGNSQALLEWNQVKGVSTYEVWYKTDIKGDAFKLYKTTEQTKLKVAKLANDTNYVFRVRAKKAGTSYYTSGDCSLHIGFQSPAPYVLKTKVASNKTKTKLTLKTTIKWDRVYGAKQIRIVGVKKAYYEGDKYIPSAETVIKTLKGTATSYTVTEKVTAADKGYNYIKVIAVNGTNEKKGITEENYKKLNDTTQLTVKRANHSGCVISWKAVPGATSYELYKTSPYGSCTLVGETAKCTYKDLNVTPGVQYTYSVMAKNDTVNITSAFNNKVKVYTHKLGTPKVASAANSAAKKATIKWNKITYASSYVVYRATSKNGKYTKVATVKKGQITYTDTKLKKGTTYYYKVKAMGKNAAGLTISSALSGNKPVKIKK